MSASLSLLFLPRSTIVALPRNRAFHPASMTRLLSQLVLDEKKDHPDVADVADDINPVKSTSEYAYRRTNVVQINDEGVRSAAPFIHRRIISDSYTPRTWRTHPLHICPPEPFDLDHPLTKTCLDWIFLISSLNFSFWSEREGLPDQYGVEWRLGWNSCDKVVHTGYWSLVAALNRALEEDIPIVDPNFYSSEVLCPDSLIEHIFRPESRCSETIPLLLERIPIMREVGFILCANFGGSFHGFIRAFHEKHNGEGSALQLVRMVTETFPSFRDETCLEGRRVYLWKRAQILVAELWAAFYPPAPLCHPLFPSSTIEDLTMFADYRVPQILHHLRILTYPPSLMQKLREGLNIDAEGREELSIRAASIVAVERVREEIAKLGGVGIPSVLIDFFLWDLAKRIESGDEKIEGIETAELVPAHRTRCTWY